MATFGDLRTRIERNLGGRDDATTQVMIMDSMNDVQLFLSRKPSQWKELQAKVTPALTIGTNEYTHTDLGLIRFRKEQQLFITDSTYNYPIDFITVERWKREVQPVLPQATSERPKVYTKWGKTFYFWYVPDDTYTLNFWYYQYPTVITATSDTPTLENVDDILIGLTTYYVAAGLEEFSLAKWWLNRMGPVFKAYDIQERDVIDFSPAQDAIDRSSVIDANAHNNPFIRSTN